MLSPARIFSVAAGLALLAAPTVSIAIPAPGDISACVTYIGGINVQQACIDQYNTIFMEARHNGNGANDWYCYDTASGRTRGGVDLDAYCRNTYGPGTYANHVGNGVFDWGCYRL